MSISVIDEFETYLRTECGLSSNTIFAYINDVKEFLDFIGPQKLTAQLIETFINHLQKKKLKPATIRRKYMSIRCFCHFFISLGHLDPNILNMIDSVRIKRRTPDALEPSDIDAIIFTIESRTPLFRTINIRRDVAIVLILYSSGLRVSELCNLNLCDINFARREIRVRGKGNRVRVVPTTQKCVEAIKVYLDSDRQSDIDAVFVKANGQRITRRSVSDMLTSLSCHAGVKHTTAHMLRRSCATSLMNHGMDLELVQTLLGHQNLVTTQAYLAISHDRLKNIHAKYHPFGAKYAKSS